MKCEYCTKELIDSISPTVSKEYKSFCDLGCMEDYYLKRISILTKSESAWHEAWWELRDIIGRHGLKLMKIEYPSYFKESK